MKILIMSLILILYSCGKKELEPVGKKASPTNDIDGDGLSLEQEKKLGSHEQIADTPSVYFKVDDSYKFLFSYNINGKQNDIEANAHFDSDQTDDFHKVAANLMMTPFDQITPLSTQLSLKLNLIARQSKIEIEKLSNLIINLYIEIDDQKHLIIESYKIQEYFYGDQVIMEQIKSNEKYFLEMLYHQKKLLVEVVDYEFDHPVLQSKTQYSALKERMKKLNAEIIIQDENSDFHLYASNLDLQEVLNYHSLSIPNTNDTESKIGQTYLLPSLSRLENRNQKRDVKKVGSLMRRNGVPISGKDSLWTQSRNILIQINGSRNLYTTNLHTYPVPKSILSPSGKCSCQLRKISTTQAFIMSHDLLKNLTNINSIEQVIEINSYTWLVIANGALNWKINSIGSNQVISGDINRTCEVFANSISGYEPAKNSYIESELTISLSQAQLSNSSEQ